MKRNVIIFIIGILVVILILGIYALNLFFGTFKENPKNAIASVVNSKAFSDKINEIKIKVGKSLDNSNKPTKNDTKPPINLKDNKIDGSITLNAFGCGPDSLMIERITRKAKEANKPILSLTIDEHTGEAGFITRLEAFIDMLFRKKRSKIINKISINEPEYTPQTNVCESILIEKL